MGAITSRIICLQSTGIRSNDCMSQFPFLVVANHRMLFHVSLLRINRRQLFRQLLRNTRVQMIPTVIANRKAPGKSIAERLHTLLCCLPSNNANHDYSWNGWISPGLRSILLTSSRCSSSPIIISLAYSSSRTDLPSVAFKSS